MIPLTSENLIVLVIIFITVSPLLCCFLYIVKEFLKLLCSMAYNMVKQKGFQPLSLRDYDLNKSYFNENGLQQTINIFQNSVVNTQASSKPIN